MITLIRIVLRLFFRFRACNTEVLKTPGPVLLIPNHVSWIDWLLVGASLDPDWKFVTSRTTAQASWFHRFVMVNRRTFPIDTESPYAVKQMADFLEKGGRLVLFAEGRMSRTGSLMKLFEGTGFLIQKTKARVITGYLRHANRQRFATHTGWKVWFPKITVHYSELLTPPRHNVSTTEERHKTTEWLRDRMIEQQFTVEMEFGPRTVPAAVARQARIRPGDVILQDLTRKKLSYRRIMVGTDVLSRQWKNLFAGQAGERIGVLLPNVNALPLSLLSLWAAGKVPAILNFSTGATGMLHCARLAGLKQIITSHKFLERANLDIQPMLEDGIQFIYLEEVAEQVPKLQKLGALLREFVAPRSYETEASPLYPKADDTAVILFTSGSEAAPKGVELTHTNLMANVRQMLAAIDIQDSDRFFNALPLFHSFGLTVGTLLPLVRGIFVFIYPSPLHYRIVPTMFYDLNCTVFFGTNTFLSGYARKAHPYDFRTLRYLFAGAEKIQESTFNTWARKFGVRVLEGYGATECSPCISANTPQAVKFGSAGRFLPGIEYKIEPVDDGVEGGRLLVRGPNVMRGYLNPDVNEKFKALGGWYDTGDIVRVDDDGFVHILGRLKRFAKISGEMVSLTAVEDTLAGAFPQFGLRFQLAVITRPDPDKGEALVAVTNEPKLELNAIRDTLRARGFSNLFVPREVKVVREIPKLGTGKVNHRELQKMI